MVIPFCLSGLSCNYGTISCIQPDEEYFSRQFFRNMLRRHNINGAKIFVFVTWNTNEKPCSTPSRGLASVLPQLQATNEYYAFANIVRNAHVNILGRAKVISRNSAHPGIYEHTLHP